MCGTSGLDTGCKLPRPEPKMCAATKDCGQWIRGSPIDCSNLCGLEEGASGTTGRVFCEPDAQCDASTKPAGTRCPGTSLCDPTETPPPAASKIVYQQKLSFSGVTAAQIDEQGKKDIESSIATSLDVKPEHVQIVSISDVADRRLRRLLTDSGVEIIYKVTVPGGNKENAPLAKELESKMNRIAAGDAPAIVAAVQNKVAEVSGVELSEIAVTATSPTESVQEKVADEKICCAALTLQCAACSFGMTGDEYCVANPNSEYCDDAVRTSGESVPLPWWLSGLVIVVVVCIVVAAGVIGKKHCTKGDQKGDHSAEVELPAIAIESAATTTNTLNNKIIQIGAHVSKMRKTEEETMENPAYRPAQKKKKKNDDDDENDDNDNNNVGSAAAVSIEIELGNMSGDKKELGINQQKKTRKKKKRRKKKAEVDDDQDGHQQPHTRNSTQLPKGWKKHLTNEGRIYYGNHATQESSWVPPEGSTGGSATRK